MNRQSFGLWGIDLDQDDFSRALAALGVIKPYYAYYPLGSLLRPSIDELERKMREVLDRLPESVKQGTPGQGTPDRNAPIEWLFPSFAILQSGRSPADPRALAEAWKRVITSQEKNQSTAGIRFEIPLRSEYPSSDGELEPDWLIEQLSRPATGVDAVYVRQEAPMSVSWNWPLRIGFLPDPESRRLRKKLGNFLYLSHLFELRELRAAAEACDLLIAPFGLRDTLSRSLATPIQASFVLLLADLADPWERAGPLIGALMAQIQAGGIGFVHPAAIDDSTWFDKLIRELSHDLGLDRALYAALPKTRPPLIFADRRLIDKTRLSDVARRLLLRASASGATMPILPSSLTFTQEILGASQLVEGTFRLRPQLEVVEPRWVQAQVFDYRSPDEPTRLRYAFRADSPHMIVVRIGPQDADWQSAPVQFPDEDLPLGDERHRLTVVFTELQLGIEPQVSEIMLPPRGPSSDCRFFLHTGTANRIEARILVLHRNRILQTALLRSPVLAEPLEPGSRLPLELTTEAVVRQHLHDLDRRRRFDAAIIVNRTSEGQDRLTAIAGRRVGVSYPEGLRQRLPTLLARLAELVEKERPRIELDRSEETLRYLARQGSNLYWDFVNNQFLDAFVMAERIQILSAKADGYLPIEFVYDGEPPDEDARLCPNARAALIAGQCLDGCTYQHPDGAQLHDTKQPSKTVCPLRFWGLSKEIERHPHTPQVVADVDELRREFALASEPTDRRNRIPSIDRALLAASARVEKYPRGEGTIESLVGSVTNAVPATIKADSWEEWVTTVAEHRPDLLVILPHTYSDKDDIQVLEVSSDARLARTTIMQKNSRYVRVTNDKHPVVFLLGCATTDPEVPFEMFPAAFRSAGAAIVLATLTPMLGRHAAPIAERLVASLVQRSRQEGTTFGAVMRDLRRELLAEGYPAALALVAYGDADWTVGAEPGM